MSEKLDAAANIYAVFICVGERMFYFASRR